MDPSKPTDGTDPAEPRVERLVNVLTRVAAGDWAARAPRDVSGDPWDVLAYMINATVEEVGDLVNELQKQRDALEATQAQLVQTAKLAALGELAGGVAHELNQPLTAIRTMVELLQMTGVTDNEDGLELIDEAAVRMTGIVDSIRTFARRSALELVALDPLVPVHAALRLMSPSLNRERITIQLIAPDELPNVMADPDRLQQVFVNLLANARDALATEDETTIGRVEIEVSHRGNAVEYVVSDSGPGVPADVAERIFDPFFTTKTVGNGTGLGLSLSFGIVEEHGGKISYERGEPTGARFRVGIPLAEPEP